MPLIIKRFRAITEFTHLCGGHLGFAYIYLINVTFIAGFRFYDPQNIYLGTKITDVSLIIKMLLARMYFYVMAITNIEKLLKTNALQYSQNIISVYPMICILKIIITYHVLLTYQYSYLQTPYRGYRKRYGGRGR